MRTFLTSLLAKCTVSVNFTGDGFRMGGTGIFGILGLIALLWLISKTAPELVTLIHAR
jgi:hypothetical protein